MRRKAGAAVAAVLLCCLSACGKAQGYLGWDSGEAQNLRIFCEKFNRIAADEPGLPRISPTQFYLALDAPEDIAEAAWPETDPAVSQEEPGGNRREAGSPTAGGAGVGQNLLLSYEALEDGRLHTLSLTGLQEGSSQEFYSASRCLVRAFAGQTADGAERWLGSLGVGSSEILGFASLEEEGFRLSYAANAAGRYFRISRVRCLPPEIEPATLRETLPSDP